MADPTHDEYQLSIPLSHCKHSQKQTAAITHQQSKFDDKAVMAYSLIYGKKHKTLLICLAKESCERIIYTVSQKNSQNCFYQNFVECPPTLIIIGTKMAKTVELCKVHSFSTSPDLCQRTTA